MAIIKLIILIGMNLARFSLFEQTTQILGLKNRWKGNNPVKFVSFTSISSLSAQKETLKHVEWKKT